VDLYLRTDTISRKKKKQLQTNQHTCSLKTNHVREHSPPTITMTPTTPPALILLTLTLLHTATLTSSQQPPVLYKVVEEQDPETYIGNVARDSLIYNQFNTSEFQNLQYSIPTTVSRFKIDSRTSTLRTAVKLDREQECEGAFAAEDCQANFDVSVYRVKADNTFQLLKIIKVTVQIDDLNDNAPYFALRSTTLDVAESAQVGQVLPLSAAIDLDSGSDNTVQTYTLLGGGDVFDLESSGPGDLGIVLRQRLDREVTSSYDVKVVAEDGGFPKLSGSIDVTIRVVDVNDNKPTFLSQTFNATVPEDSPEGHVVLTLLASDPDMAENGHLTFTFSSVTPSKVKTHFAINSSSGELKLVKALDYEKDKLFRFTAVVSDGGSPMMTSQAAVVIQVKDVNDNAPQIDVTLPATSVLESISIDTYIGHISLSDLDSSQNTAITCQLSNPHFQLKPFPDQPSIFTVELKAPLDYERSRSEAINVTCSDGGSPPRTNSSSFTLHVTDANDNAPVFERSSFIGSVTENNYIGAFVVQILAVDPDDGLNGNVTYSLARGSDDMFQINPMSGVLKVMQVLDREDQAEYELTVMATDKGVVPISSSVTVTVQVTDENDNPPFFIRPHFEMRVQENKPRHTVVDTLFTQDPDVDVDNHLRYQFYGNFTYKDVFGIDKMSGTIYTLTTLDREVKDLYTFKVRVYDESKPDFEDVAQVSVVIRDDNDNRPNITYPNSVNNTFKVTYTQPAGSIVLTVEAEDGDAHENASVKFSILHGNEDNLFFVNSKTGDLIIAKRLSPYNSGTYHLIINARDGGPAYLETQRAVNVMITLANGTSGLLTDEPDNANMAIVVALVCITAVLAIAVLVTICIIRRIDRERKHHNNAKVEEENIYKQQVPSRSEVISGTGSDPRRSERYENEIDKLKKKIKRDLSFVAEEDSRDSQSHSNSMDLSETTKNSSFSTFKNTTADSDHKMLSSPQAQSSVLHNTLSPSESNSKHAHYTDKAKEIDRLTSAAPPPRSHPPGAYHSGRGVHWGANTTSPRPITSRDDATSHSSGSTSDSGRGFSEEGESLGHVMVSLGNDGDRGRQGGQLSTFNSPRSTASSSGTSAFPRSLSTTSYSSETAQKRLWAEQSSSDATTADNPRPRRWNSTTDPGSSMASSSGTTIGMDDDLPPPPPPIAGLPETSAHFKPNISFSDDSLTANTTVGKSFKRSNIQNTATLPRSPMVSMNPNMSSNLKNNRAMSVDALGGSNLPPRGAMTSTTRPRVGSYPNSSEAAYHMLTPNISRIPSADDTSSQHGMYVDLDPSAVIPDSRSYANATNNRNVGGSARYPNNSINHSGNHGYRDHDRFKNTFLNKYGNNSHRNYGNSVNVSDSSRVFQNTNGSQQSTMGEAYSLGDVCEVLGDASRADGSVLGGQSDVTGTNYDDDNTTTTSGSYTINAEDLCQEIDQLFFKDIVV